MTPTWAILIGLLGDVNVAGSVYLNHPQLFSDRIAAAGSTLRGANAEASVKMVADVSDDVVANIKVCYGCHGFEADMAYVDWSVDDAFNVRFGRFPVPFGEFYLRYDAANHRSATKPLPYEMGRMLRRAEFNLAILPEPYPDNGVEIFGTLGGESVEVSYSTYAVSGLKGNAADGDVDFVRSRREYFVDNNGSPAVGGRVSIAFPELPTNSWRWLAIGASAMYGMYDDEDELPYLLAGVDVYTRISTLNVRGEVLMRRTAIPDDTDRFQQRLRSLFVQREGFYLQLDGPLTKRVEWLARYDGFRRAGPLLIGSPLTSTDSAVTRGTFGINLVATKGVKLKVNYELWKFDDFPDEQMLHTGLIGTF